MEKIESVCKKFTTVCAKQEQLNIAYLKGLKSVRRVCYCFAPNGWQEKHSRSCI